MALLGVGLAFAATPASACGAYGYAGYGYGGSGYGSAVMVAAAHTVTRVTVVLTTVLTVTPVTTAHITGLMDNAPIRSYGTAVRWLRRIRLRASSPYGGCGTYGYAGYRRHYYGVTDAPCITAHITGLMDTHHSSRGIEFIDRFTLSQVTCPAIAPLATGVRVWMLDALLTRCG